MGFQFKQRCLLIVYVFMNNAGGIASASHLSGALLLF